MNCQQFTDCLADYLESELSPARAAECAEHLAACPTCRQNAAELQQIRALVLTAGSLPARAADAARATADHDRATAEIGSATAAPRRAIRDESATRLRRRIRLSVVVLRYAAVFVLAFGGGYIARRPQVETRIERIPQPAVALPITPSAVAADPKLAREYEQINAAHPDASNFGKTLILLAKK